jgi:ankyrin repeat protein
VGELVKQGANVNDKDDDGQTALHKAAASGQKVMVVLLLALGADLTERDNKGRTALMTAANAGHAEVAKVLVTPSAVRDAAGDAIGKAFSGFKIDVGGLGRGFEENATDSLTQADNAGQTPLMLAAAGGHADCVLALFIHRDVNFRVPHLARTDKKGNTALHLAAAAGRDEVLHLLLFSYAQSPDDLYKLSHLRVLSPDGKTALEIAEAGGHKRAAEVLAGAMGAAAAAEDDLKTLQQLRGKYALNLAPPNQLLEWAAKARSMTVLRALLDEHKDKSSKDKLRLFNVLGPQTGNTPLWAALGSDEVLDLLLDPKWWKDDEAIIAFIECKNGPETVLTNKFYRENAPKDIEKIEKALAVARKSEKKN